MTVEERKTIEELQRELLERQLAEQRREDAERVREIQARCRDKTVVCETCGRRGQYRKSTLIERYGDLVGPDMLVAVANCPRHKALGEERCGVVFGELLALDSFFAPVPPIGDRC